ncbi:MAG: DegV family protein [Ruminiclostridium sp.]|nr:DegV family protein [Ruminiclostridium sp.]
MSKYKIIADSGCDISVEDEKRWGIDIMPFDVTIGGETIRERVDISGEEFLRRIAEEEEIPKTSQITQFRFEEKFEECVNEGFEDVIVILINGAGSATYSNAVNAAAQLKEDGKSGNTKFHIFDSRTYSIGYGYPAVEAAKKLEAGQSMDIVLAYLEDWFASCELYLMLFNLRHAKKSGRIKAAAAVMGELMNIKPIVEMIDDHTKVVGKPRGEKKAVDALVEYAMTRAIPHTPFLIGRSLATELEDEFIEKYKAKSGCEPGMVHSVGSVVGANAGTSFIGLFIKGARRD